MDTAVGPFKAGDAGAEIAPRVGATTRDRFFMFRILRAAPKPELGDEREAVSIVVAEEDVEEEEEGVREVGEESKEPTDSGAAAAIVFFFFGGETVVAAVK